MGQEDVAQCGIIGRAEKGKRRDQSPDGNAGDDVETGARACGRPPVQETGAKGPVLSPAGKRKDARAGRQGCRRQVVGPYRRIGDCRQAPGGQGVRIQS